MHLPTQPTLSTTTYDVHTQRDDKNVFLHQVYEDTSVHRVGFLFLVFVICVGINFIPLEMKNREWLHISIHSSILPHPNAPPLPPEKKTHTNFSIAKILETKHLRPAECAPIN